MSVVMASREATTTVGQAVRLMVEKEALAVPAAVVCGVKRGFSVGRAIVEVDERGEGEGELSSESSSSIGEAEEESSLSVSTSSVGVSRGEEAEVQSRWRSKGTSLSSLESLEEALPIKRGLSSFFNGKSKSFACLSEAASASTTARDLAKPENPFNKRRRILVSCKPSWRRRASYGSLLYSSSSSLGSGSPSPSVRTADVSSLGSDEEEEDGQDESNESGDSFSSPIQPTLLRFHQGSSGSMEGLGMSKAFRSPRSFSLSDLRQHARKC